MLEHGLRGLLSCFYPADNLRDNKALSYYRQREWRIAWNYAIGGGDEVMRQPSNQLLERLLDIDPEFFGRPFQTPQGTKRLGEAAYIFPGVGNKKIIQMVERVIVPSAAMSRVQPILTRFSGGVPIVCIEDL